MSAILSSPTSPALAFAVQKFLAPANQALGVDPIFSIYGAPTDVMINNVMNGNFSTQAITGSLLQASSGLISSIKNDMAIILSNPANLRAPVSSQNPFAVGNTSTNSNMMNLLAQLFDTIKPQSSASTAKSSGKLIDKLVDDNATVDKK